MNNDTPRTTAALDLTLETGGDTGENHWPLTKLSRELEAECEEWKQRAEDLARTVMADMGNAREPLTTAQIDALVADVYRNCGHMQTTPEIIVRAIERAHGIGA